MTFLRPAWLIILTLLAPGALRASETRSFVSGGRTITADYFAPAAVPATHRTILVLHGAGGTLFDGPEMRRMALRLAAEGNAVYLLHYFDRTGSHFFLGDRGLLKNFDTWLETVRDSLRWIAQEQGNHARIGLYGYSLGAFLAVAAASENPRVGAIAEQAGGVWNNETKRLGSMPPGLMIHGMADGRVPFEKYALPLQRYLRRHAPTVTTHFVPGEGHGFSAAAQARVREEVAGYFRQTLR